MANAKHEGPDMTADQARKGLWAGAALRAVIAGVPAAIALAACGERPVEPQPSEAAKVVGVPPARPTADPATVKPVAPGVTELEKAVEIAAMPLPGQADGPETLAALNSQRSEAIDVLKDPELAKIANSDAALEEWRQKRLRQAQVNQLQRSRQTQAKGPAPS